ncbi:hypothetical protein LCGC14_0714770 [marine sediment metagenome]|uniref:Uncharacterized protein n=1 Tax=marine sediment metagenome TaxID=412755 RepID=A0A0F9QZH0_9ZZZZ
MGKGTEDEKYLKDIADSAVNYIDGLIKKKEFGL